MIGVLNTIGVYCVPFIMLLILTIGLVKKVDIYATFVEGAKEGFQTAITIIPFLVGMFVGIAFLRESGAMQMFGDFVSPVTNLIKVPADIIPLFLLRPFGGAMGVATEVISTHGANSIVGQMAAVMVGSTETTLYVLAVYFGAVGIKRERHALVTGLTADVFGLAAAIYISQIFFGWV